MVMQGNDLAPRPPSLLLGLGGWVVLSLHFGEESVKRAV